MPSFHARSSELREPAAAKKKSGGKKENAEAAGKRGYPTGKFAFEFGK